MIDTTIERVISLTEAAKHHVPHRGVHLATLYRWGQRGIKGVRLEVVQVGGTKCTSLEALQRFFERLGAVNSGETPPTRTASQRERSSAKANQELAKAGW